MPVKFILDKRPTSDDRSWTLDALRRRLAGVPLQDLDRAARRVIDVLSEFNRAPPARRARAAADFLRAHVEGLMPRLLARVEGAAPPLTKQTRQQADLIAELLEELALAYTLLVARSAPSWSPFTKKKPSHAPLVRAMDLLARRLQLSYRLYARPPRGVWSTMHELYQIARARKAAELPLTDPDATAGAIYRKALLLAFADPSRLSSPDLQRAADYIGRFAADAFLSSESAPANAIGVFIVDVSTDRPGLPIARHKGDPRPARALFLRTRHLLVRVRSHIGHLSAGTPPDELGLPDVRDPAHYRALLSRLGKAWSGAPRKRASRMQFRPRAVLEVGMRAVWVALGGGGLAEAGGEDETPLNEWAIVNESPGGFALHHVTGFVPPLRIGDVVSLRRRGRGDVFVCLLRWIQSDSLGSIDIGLQQIAPRVAPVTYRLPDARGAAIVPALFAPTAPQYDRAPLIITPSRVLGAERDFTINYLGAALRLRAEQVMERTPLVEFLRVSGEVT